MYHAQRLASLMAHVSVIYRSTQIIAESIVGTTVVPVTSATRSQKCFLIITSYLKISTMPI